jgi:hypothetical protein
MRAANATADADCAGRQRRKTARRYATELNVTILWTVHRFLRSPAAMPNARVSATSIMVALKYNTIQPRRGFFRIFFYEFHIQGYRLRHAPRARAR